ncbi:hypothetical protein [Thalassobius sp. I31.1]|uniref:hypothetical protein n=1 Tax=Thalassobius sp. I31.1 TaxID=2109912 RepID=UPI0013008A77|nr:hypothetical protein [Thalassobius sp. I31.1]
MSDLRNCLTELEGQLYQRVPPSDPPACHWLRSDAGPSYCETCAWNARWKELPTFGEPPEIKDWYRNTEFEEHLHDGIGSSYDAESDTPEHCETCGCQLSYCLTPEGCQSEIEHFSECSLTNISGETTYALSRAFINLGCLSSDFAQIPRAIQIVKRALIAPVSEDQPHE